MTARFPYDEWEHTEAALRAIFKLIHLLHENKPAKGSAAEKIWEAELVEVRAWAVQIHDRRIELNLKELAVWRKNKRNGSPVPPGVAMVRARTPPAA